MKIRVAYYTHLDANRLIVQDTDGNWWARPLDMRPAERGEYTPYAGAKPPKRDVDDWWLPLPAYFPLYGLVLENPTAYAIRYYRRTIARLTQGQLAEKISSTQAQIARYESGEQSPTVDALRNIAEALEIEPAKLI